MIYAGIDIAKLKHFASALSSDGEILIEPFKFTNDNDGFQLLISKIESFDQDNIIFGLESTVTTLFDTLLLEITKCMFLIPSRLLLCEK